MLVYIHIPFCDSKCFYCAFNSFSNKNHLKESYLNALLLQTKNDLKEISNITSVFIGGGTPSVIESSFYEKLFSYINPKLTSNAEITIEANPNVSLQWLQKLRFLTNRISFGVQSFNDKKLTFLGRNHSSFLAINTIKNAKKAGFKNISLDLIYDTIYDTKELLGNDLKTSFSLPINHLSAYSLTIEKNTPFYKKPQNKKENLSLTNFLFEKITSYGFKQYEISNFGTYFSKHNLGYWEGKEYIGLGAGAVGFVGNKRLYPHKNLTKYIKDPLFKEIEPLEKDDLIVEKIFLGFRSIVGVNEKILNKSQLNKANILINEKKLKKVNDTFFNENFLLADELALFILE